MSSRIQQLMSRRSLLRSSALLALAAPVVRRMETAEARQDSPARVILLFTPNGPMNKLGPATGTEDNFQLVDWWQPLERHRNDAIFMSHTAPAGTGVNNSRGGHGLGGQGFSGYGTFTKTSSFYAANGESVDQVIAKGLEQEGRAGVRRSLTWGTTGRTQTRGTGDPFSAGKEQHIAPEVSPEKAWADLFSGFMAPAAGAGDAEAKAKAEYLLRREQSILDFVHQDCKLLTTDLGVEGMRLLDDHCSTIRAMEQNLASTLMPGGSCAAPTKPATLDWEDPENLERQTEAFFEIIATTLACELSHVIGFQYGGQAARNRLPASYKVPESSRVNSGDSGPAHHPWTHQRRSETKSEAISIFTKFYSEQASLLIDKLKSTNDMSGKPLLDSTVVLWLSELGGHEKNDDGHQCSSLPAVLFGNGLGKFKTGRYVRGKSSDVGNGGEQNKAAGREAAEVLISLVHHMGLTNINTVGATDAKGPAEFLLG